MTLIHTTDLMSTHRPLTPPIIVFHLAAGSPDALLVFLHSTDPLLDTPTHGPTIASGREERSNIILELFNILKGSMK